MSIEASALDDTLYCSGFEWLEWFYRPVSICCRGHDDGQPDGWLLDCLMNATPEWSWALVAFCVALMILLRPIYRLIKPKGNARH